MNIWENLLSMVLYDREITKKGGVYMPYIAIKAYPKDAETKKKVVDEINAVFIKYWGCPQAAISISIEEFLPEEWDEKVVKPEIETKPDKMMIVSGEKKY